MKTIFELPVGTILTVKEGVTHTVCSLENLEKLDPSDPDEETVFYDVWGEGKELVIMGRADSDNEVLVECSSMKHKTVDAGGIDLSDFDVVLPTGS